MRIAIKRNKINKFSIIIFFILYFTVGTLLQLPAGELLRWGGCVLLAIIGTKDSFKTKKSFHFFPSYYLYLIVPFVLSMFGHANISVYGTIRFSSFLLLIFSLYSYYNRKKVDEIYIQKHFEIFAKILCLITIIQIILLLLNINEFGTFKGIYDNKNYFTTISSVSLISSLWLILNNKNYKYSIFLFSNIILLISTGSRTGVVSLFIIMLCLPFIIYNGNTLRNILKVMLSIMILGLICILVLKKIELPALSRLLAPESSDGSTGFERTGYWDAAIPLFKQKPIFGWGNSAADYYISNSNTLYNWGFHNTYLIILVENGIIGSFFYSCFFITGLFKNMKKYIKLDLFADEKIFIKTLTLICIVLLINAFTESFLFAAGNPMAVCFWFSFIILDKYIELKFSKEQ